jgi:glycosyl transferase family 4
MGLRILITTMEPWRPSGTAIYVRDLALELQRQGHSPTVFGSTRGGIVDELLEAGIPVTASLSRVKETPDVIHGHQYAPTLIALRRWPRVPAIHVCHDHTSLNERTPIHTNIRRHFGVSRVCVQRLLTDGVPASRASLLLNFVDMARFTPRSPLPTRPRRALVFSNYAHEDSHLPAVREACRHAGLELDVAGAGVGRIVAKPERMLGQYDIVFAKAKAAMEAMAVGTSVILCDYSGVGPMVTSAEFDRLQPLNFGFDALRDPLEREPLLREIGRYDPEDAVRVRDLIRSRAGLVAAVERLTEIYDEAITEHRSARPHSIAPRPARWLIRERLFLRLYWRWMSLSQERRELLARLPGVQVVKHGARRLFGQTG